MTRISLTAFLCLFGALFLWSCCPEDPFVATNQPDIPLDSAKQAFLRVVVADPDITPVNVLVDGENTFSSPIGYFDYPEAVYEAQFWPVDTAATELSFAMPDGSIVAATSVSFPKGSYHTAYLYRQNGMHRIIVTTDNPTAGPDIGSVRFRIVNLSLESPTVDITFRDKQSGEEFIVDDLGYGDTTAILTQTAALQKELYVTESGSGRRIIALPSVLLPGGSVLTLVMTGRLRPRGDEKFLFFNNFTDSRLDAQNGLYGSLPLALELTALRFVNLVGYADSTLDLTLKDTRFGCDFPDCFRRNFPGQPDAVIDVAGLGADPAKAEKGYFFLSTLLYKSIPYRVEVHSLDISVTSQRQTVLVPEKPFDLESSKRYTVVAFGEFDESRADAVTIFDRTPPPPAGQVNVRFFHGAFEGLRNEQLQARVNGVTGPMMSYGTSPDPITDSYTVSPSPTGTIEILDESGTVVHTETNVEFRADKTYTIFLSRGPAGNGLQVKAVSDDVVPE